MALEAIVYPQQQEDPFGINPNYILNHTYYPNDSPNYILNNHHDYYPELPNNHDDHYNGYCTNNNSNNDDGLLLPYDCYGNSYVDTNDGDYHYHHHQKDGGGGGDDVAVVGPTKVKRRRARVKKNKEEVESQRMTHIAVERNRRKQMNDYLGVLRSLMPRSYVTRGDQASIVGGAINFVKELEHNLHSLSAKKQMGNNNYNSTTTSPNLPFEEFFTFPQYSSTSASSSSSSSLLADDEEQQQGVSRHISSGGDTQLLADVEVTMVDSHALLKVRTRYPPKQLSKLVCGLQGLRLSILHMNVCKVDGVAFYSFSLKVEEESRLSSVDEIASAVYQLLNKIQVGPTF